MLESFQNVVNSVIASIPTLLHAIALIVISILVAMLVRGIILKLGRKLKLDVKLGKFGLSEETCSLKFLANFLALLVFILFLPGILETLGLRTVTVPINTMITDLLSFIPHLLGATIVLFVGYYGAKIVKQIVVAILRKTKLDSFQDKLNIQGAPDTVKFSAVIGNIVFALVFIPLVVSALDILGIEAISAPSVGMLTTIFDIIPNIFAAILLVIAGILIARLVHSILFGLLSSFGIDNLIKRIKGVDSENKFSLVKIITETVKFIIVVLFIVQALNVLNLEFMSNVGAVIISYLPSLIFAFIIAIAGYIFASWLRSIIDASTNGKRAAVFAQYSVLVLTGFIVLNQLGFAMEIVNIVFLVIIGAAAVAFAIAFGIGGRDFAARLLSKAEVTKAYDKEDISNNVKENSDN